MDDDQCARRNLQLFFGIRDPDYYEFEGTIWRAFVFLNQPIGIFKLSPFIRSILQQVK